MVVSLRKKRARVLPYRIVLWSILAILIFARGIQDHPIAVEATLDLTDGVELTRQARADILVVLDYEAIRQSGNTFTERDWSGAWINLIEQEIGPVSIATPETLSQDDLDSARIVILTSSVSRDMPEALIERARKHALDGQTLVIERPEGRARELFSANGRGGVRRGQSITHAEGLADPFAGELRQMPLFTDYVGSTSPREGARTYLSIDGAPVIYAVDFGDGQVITVDFNFGEQLISLQQGRPDENFRLRTDDSSQSQRTPRTRDLLSDDKLLGASVPFADLLERFIVYGVLMREEPMPAYWIYPNAADGAVIFAHEDSRLGDGGAWMLEYENERGGASTLLTTVDAGLTREGAERIHRYGGEIGLAWRFPEPSVALYESYGLGTFHPLRKPIELDHQLSDLRRRLPVGYVRSARSLEGVWSSHWSEPLAALSEAGIRADLSYEVPTHRGYAFGTGLPFLAMSDQGIPLGIRQYPIVVPARADHGPEIDELLKKSSEGHHQLITIATRPSVFADYPDMDDFEQWLQTFSQIEERNHVILNVLRFDGYQRQRRAGAIRSRFVTGANLPEDARSQNTAPNHRGAVLRVTVEARERGMNLMIPQRVGDAEFLLARRGTSRVGSEVVSSRVDTEDASIVGFPLRRVPLEQGSNGLEFYYH